MHAINDVKVLGLDLATAVRRILPPTMGGELGMIIIRPGNDPSMLELEAFYASASVPAEGPWTDAIEVNARMFQGFMSKKPPAVFRLVFFDGRLSVNNSTIGANLATSDPSDARPSKVWTKRRKMPWVGRGLKHSRFRVVS
jgi:hypothetical protein